MAEVGDDLTDHRTKMEYKGPGRTANRPASKSPPARVNTLFMGAGDLPQPAKTPKVKHDSALLPLSSPRMDEVCSFLGRVFCIDPYSLVLWPDQTELKTRMWLNAMVRASRWRKNHAFCVITYDVEGEEEGQIKAASLWNVPTSFLTYVYLLFDSLWNLGIMSTIPYFKSIFCTMDSDFTDLYKNLHDRLLSLSTAPIYHLDFIGADPSYQGRGYGTSCLRFGVEHAEKNKWSIAMISSNPRNVPFYIRNGFQALGTKVCGVVLTGMFRPLTAEKISILLTSSSPSPSPPIDIRKKWIAVFVLNANVKMYFHWIYSAFKKLKTDYYHNFPKELSLEMEITMHVIWFLDYISWFTLV